MSQQHMGQLKRRLQQQQHKGYQRDYQLKHKEALRNKEQTYVTCPECASVALLGVLVLMLFIIQGATTAALELTAAVCVHWKKAYENTCCIV